MVGLLPNVIHEPLYGLRRALGTPVRSLQFEIPHAARRKPAVSRRHCTYALSMTEACAPGKVQPRDFAQKD